MLLTAIEEILRFDGPARATVRLVRDTDEIAGRKLEEGQRVFLVNLAANRDPEHSPSPTASTCAATPTRTSASASPSTTASARRSLAWRVSWPFRA